MKAPLHLAALLWIGIASAGAQNVPPEAPEEDPVQQAIREFNDRDPSKPNEITVVLDPPSETAGPQATPAETPAQEKTGGTPVLVTGRPPDSAAVDDATTAAEAPVAEPPPPAEPKKGLTVRVEKLQAGSGKVDPSKVKLLAPFPAKPLSQPPAGWKLQPSESAPPFVREVELAPGRKMTLTVKPQVLVPEVDGSTSFSIAEPGYNPALGYQQDGTVGAVLSRSIRELDDDSKALGIAVDNLQQLLVSLPKSEPPSSVPPSPSSSPESPANPRKR